MMDQRLDLTGTAPNLNYNPSTDYVGLDSFTFKANDDIESNYQDISSSSSL
jgi:hypothetical protein